MGAVSLVDQDTRVFIFPLLLRMIMFQISQQSKIFCFVIAKYQPLYFKIHLPFRIIDEDRNTHTTISCYMVLLHNSLTDKIHRTEIPPTYSDESLMLPTLCCSFFPKCSNAWPYMRYGNVSCKKLLMMCNKGK